MKIVGIQLKSNEAILVVLQKKEDGTIEQLDQSTKFGIDDSQDGTQVRQFRNQVNATLDTIRPDRIVVVARQSSGRTGASSSPLSFKLEGIIQLYDKVETEFMWPATIAAFKRKNTIAVQSKKKFQQDAFEAAYVTLNK